MWGGGGKWGGPYGCHMSQNLHLNTQFLRFYKNHYIIGLDSERAGSRTLENFRGETETEIVQNSKVLVDFEVRT